MRRFILVAYDIADDKRRNRVAKAMLDFGDRVQFSVFCCQLNRQERIQMGEALKSNINQVEDQILFLDAGPVTGANPKPDLKHLGKIYSPLPRYQIV